MPEILNTITGQDSIKGGIFYGSNLTPQGSFSNVPKKTEITIDLETSKPQIKLTLEKFKNSFNQAIKNTTKTDNVLSENSINNYLKTYTQLLIDYEDLSNLVCFGSSYNELVYNIDYLINNFPYRAYVARQVKNLRIKSLSDNTTKIYIKNNDVVFPGNLSFDNSGKTTWVGKESNSIGYDFIDKKSDRFPILEFNNTITKDLIDVNIKAVDFYRLKINDIEEIQAGDIITFYDSKNDIIGTGKVQEYIPIEDNLSSFGLVQKTYKCFSQTISQTNLETNNIIITHNLNSNNLSIKAFKNILEDNSIFDIPSNSYEKIDKNMLVLKQGLMDSDWTILITSLIEQEGNVIIDAKQNWDENSLINNWVEINNIQYKIISNTNNSITLENNINFKINDFYIVEKIDLINSYSINNEVFVEFNIRFTPNLFVNSYATDGNYDNDNNVFILIDDSKNWGENKWQDKYITIIEGPGSGKTFKIISNTNNKLIINGNFGVKLNNTSRYLIVNYPSIENQIVCPMSIMEFTLQGNLSLNGLINFSISDTEIEKGFIIAPKLSKIYNFTTQLSGIQKALLNPINPTPWPRERFTENIITSGSEFINWIENPYNMTKIWSNDDDFYRDEEGKYNLIGAITLDETKTNQLIRRCVPPELINELNETENKLFSRFILLAGKMFDTIKVYIDFIKHTHTLNYSKINQLSPQFYKQYAEHYGFSLFEEDQLELAKTIIYGDQLIESSSLPTFSDNQNITTVKDIINEKQKLLLINLFHLYQTKGTVDCLTYLTSLLGAPEGLVLIEEFAFNSVTKEKISDNNKVNVPNIKLVIDESYFVVPDKYDPRNFPYVYKYELDNDDIINLRELSIGMSPLKAILQDILKYGEIATQQGIFKNRSYGSLQNNNEDYFALPLTFPDKYNGIEIGYMIPKGGFKKGIITNQCDCSFNLCGLNKLNKIYFKTPIIDIDENNITTDGDYYIIPIKLEKIPYLTQSMLNNGIRVVFDNSDAQVLIQNIENDEESSFTTIFIRVYKTYINKVKLPGYVLSSIIYDSIYSEIEPLSWTEKFRYKIPPINISADDNLSNYDVVVKKDNLLQQQLVSNKFSFPEDMSNYGNLGDEITINFGTVLKNVEFVSYKIGSFKIKSTTAETILDIIENINSNYSYPNFNIISNIEEIYFIANYDTIFNADSKIYFTNIDNNNVGSIITFPETDTSQTNYQENDYIFTRIEDKDLVIRLRITSETDNVVYNKIALFENIFEDDGLNHKLRLLFTYKGAEVYKDNVFLGFAYWKKVEVPNSKSWTPRTYPKSEINSLEFSSFPSEMFAEDGLSITGKDNYYWWDMFTGYPSNIDVSLFKISILENLYISQPNIIDIDQNSYINEKWIFDFSNQIKDKNDNYITKEINIACDYQLGNPHVMNNESYYISNIESYILANIDKINLTSKLLTSGKVEFKNDSVDFFKNNIGIQINSIEDLFKFNAYNDTLHKDYEYKYLNSLIENYYEYASVALTYKNLLPFLETIESKFKRITDQFLPIVLNLATFGRTIQNYFAKVHYNNAFANDKATRITDDTDPDILSQVGSNLLTISYSKPITVIKKQNEFIYYKNENKDDIFIYEQIENKDDLTIKTKKES